MQDPHIKVDFITTRAMMMEIYQNRYKHDRSWPTTRAMVHEVMTLGGFPPSVGDAELTFSSLVIK